MASSDIAEPSTGSDRSRRVVLIGLLVLVAVAAAGVWGVLRFVENQRQLDLQNWQVRLGIVADSRTAAVEDWIGQQFATLTELSENASLQLYMTELTLSREADGSPLSTMPEGSYLRNLLVVAAQNAGFTAERPAAAVPANVEPAGQAGIALTDALGNLLVATPEMPPISQRVKGAMREAAGGSRGLVDMHIGSNGEPRMGFVVPVYAIQQDAASSKHIGFVVGLRGVDRALFGLLRQPGDTAKSAETYLVRRDGSTVEYLSPLAGGSDPLERRLAMDTAELAAAFVVQHPGGFGIKRDYQGQSVLVTGRALANAPWYLVRTIGRDEALADSERRQKTLLTVFLLIIAGVTAAIVAVWRYGISVRSSRLAEQYRDASQRLREYSDFMEVVTDSQPTAICVVDEEGHYSFANRTAAAGTGVGKQDLLGKSIAAVLGPVRAKELEAANREALATGEPVSRTLRFEDNERHATTFDSDHIPLAGQLGKRSVLMVLNDVTDIVRERERRERTMRDLVRTLVAIVDQRDRYSAHQSARVAEVSVAIAREMGLGNDYVQTVDIAGYLVNLGKIVVPEKLLMKSGPLSDEEREFIRQSMLKGADLLDSVDFDLPVQETLRQLQEHWDGSGYPHGLAGESILVSARIIAVANAFVGMVSPRAYRDALSFGKACEIMLGDAGRKFDRRPVTALINFIENRGGKDKWAHYQHIPELSAWTAEASE